MLAVRRERGMTLVEVLVAFTLLVLTCGVSFQVLATARASQARSEARASAAFVARSVLDQARAGTFDQLVPRTGTITLPVVRNGVALTQAWSYSLDVLTEAPNLKRVWVTVTWPGGPDAEPLVVETLVFRP